MLNAIKRLALGVSLIGLASAILLFSDRGHRTAAPSPQTAKRIAIVQHATTAVLDDGVRGVLDGLAERGYRDGDKIVVQRFNAHGDMPTGIAIAKQVTGGDFDLVITSSTPSLQAVANNNRAGKVRHLFTLVADPFLSGVGLERADPLKHPPFMAGSSFPLVERRSRSPHDAPPASRIGVA
jgi:putative ABC transport system substrate-binding protein